MAETRARLENWARWGHHYAAIAAELEVSYDPVAGRYYCSDRAGLYGANRAGFTPDELDAQLVERVMLRLRKSRRQLFWALWERYMIRPDSPIPAADAHGWSVQRYFHLVREGEAWVKRQLG